mmetsp:Transcript_7467/g.26561  ORF Transcript_7467/g.26561 Transcript_7467/m.26561 type:complete len:201 (+) Transcript_7467:1061-1663(+)
MDDERGLVVVVAVVVLATVRLLVEVALQRADALESGVVAARVRVVDARAHVNVRRAVRQSAAVRAVDGASRRRPLAPQSALRAAARRLGRASRGRGARHARLVRPHEVGEEGVAGGRRRQRLHRRHFRKSAAAQRRGDHGREPLFRVFEALPYLAARAEFKEVASARGRIHRLGVLEVLPLRIDVGNVRSRGRAAGRDGI